MTTLVTHQRHGIVPFTPIIQPPHQGDEDVPVSLLEAPAEAQISKAPKPLASPVIGIEGSQQKFDTMECAVMGSLERTADQGPARVEPHSTQIESETGDQNQRYRKRPMLIDLRAEDALEPPGQRFKSDPEQIASRRMNAGPDSSPQVSVRVKAERTQSVTLAPINRWSWWRR